MDQMIWIGIAFCIVQSAMFSGLNLAYFSLSRLRLQAESSAGNRQAKKVLQLRRDSNFLLATILWGNVAINVLLTLLSNSVLAGLSAFAFSTLVITFLGEIIPQAYCSRRALKVAAAMAPMMRIYQFILYPLARPSGWFLDTWLGKETTAFLDERQLESYIQQHIKADDTEVDAIEGKGALNFLRIDDVPSAMEGEEVHPSSIIALPTNIDLPVFPAIDRTANDPFIQRVNASGKKWVVLTDSEENPRLLLDADAYLRAAVISTDEINPYDYCHRPIIIQDAQRPLGHLILDMRADFAVNDDAAIDKDVALLWDHDTKRVITGADLLGRLLRGISSQDAVSIST
ncbi:MAG: DUF21 domain-containing protein [Gammaproteobacteria bacterium]